MTAFTVTKGFAARAGAASTAAAAIRRPASATVICAIPTALRATADRCRETTVCWSEIATDLQEMTACTEETARRSRRPTARRREMSAGRD